MDGFEVAPAALAAFSSAGTDHARALAGTGLELESARLGDGSFGRSRMAGELTVAYERCLAVHAGDLAATAGEAAWTAEATGAAAGLYARGDEAATGSFTAAGPSGLR